MTKRKREISEVHETPSPYLTDEEIIRVIEERLPRLLEQKPELRQKLKLLLPDLATKEDIKAILEELKRMREDWEQRFQAIQSDSERRFLYIQQENKEMREDWERRFQAIQSDSERRFLYIQQENKEMREDWERRFQAIQAEIKEMREDWEQRFQALKEEVNALKEEVKILKQEVNALKEEVNILKEEVKILKEEVKILKEEVKILKEEVKALKEEVNILREEVKALRREMYEELARLRKEMHEELKKIRQDFHNIVSAVGSRWGENIEESFRLGVGTILRESFGVDAQEVWIDDREGRIKGYPARYQVDLLITNSHHILIEIKSSVGDLDVNKLHHLGKLYEREKGVKPRLLLLTGYARSSAREEAQKLGDVEILTRPDEVKESGDSLD